MHYNKGKKMMLVEEMDVYTIAYKATLKLYKMTASFPNEERYGIVSQMRKAAVSIVSNMSEGSARGSTKDYMRFLIIARGSVAEVKTQLSLAQDLGYAKAEDVNDIIKDLTRTKMMLNKMITKFESELDDSRLPTPDSRKK